MKTKKIQYYRWMCCTLIVWALGSINAPTVTAQELQPLKIEESTERAPVTSAEDVKWLNSELEAPKKHAGLRTVTDSDAKKFEALLIKTLQARNTAKSSVTDFNDQWEELQWQIRLSPSKSFFTIREHANHRHGRGVYAFRINAETTIALQAPHRFSDLMTGSIATDLFCENSIFAIALNTVHRKVVDLSHAKRHYVNAFTSALITAKYDVAIVQLHGFTNEGKAGAAKFAHAIVSDTTKFPGRSARQTALELKTTFEQDHTRLFPVDIQELGGTTNRQAQIAYDLGCLDFLHVELNHEFRTRLMKDASVRDSFFASILRGTAK